jgi:hypothetical protein
MFRKNIILILILVLTTACTISDKEENSQSVKDSHQDNELTAEENPLNNLLFNDVNKTLYYDGMAEYGHNETLANISYEEDTAVYLFEGVLTDGRGLTDENGNPLSFERKYMVTNQMIKTEISSANLDDVNISLFKEKVLLKQPLTEGNSWSEQVTYEGKTYEAVSTIIGLSQNEDGAKVYEVETVVEDIKGFTDDDIYKERIRIEEGIGVISFENTRKEFSPPLEDGFTFGFGLTDIR